MIKEISLTNFRIIGDQQKFELSPITILIGPNNSGKSTVIRALKLLSESAKLLKFGALPLMTTESNYRIYSLLKNNKAESSVIEFELKIDDIRKDGISLAKNTTIKLHYNKENNNFGNNLKYFQICNSENQNIFTIIADKTNEYKINIDKNWFYKKFLKNDAELKKEISNNWKISNMKFDNIKKYISDYSFFYDGDFENLSLILNKEIGIANYNYDNFKSINNYLDIIILKSCIEIIDIISDNVAQNVFYIPVNRVQPKRDFYFGESNFISKLLFEKILMTKSIVKGLSLHSFTDHSRRQDRLFDFCNYCLKNIYSLNYAISFKLNPESGNFELICNVDGYKMNVADLGHGLYQLIILLINIDMAGSDFKCLSLLKNVPRYSKSILLIEEPEINLHPNYQSKLADVFCYAYKKFGIKFVVETHSEYLIRKLQYLVAHNDFESKDVLIYYFNSDNIKDTNDESVKKIQKIMINTNGNISEPFGDGFTDEAITWKFELLKLQQSQQN